MFKKAKPIFLKDLSQEMNIPAVFTCQLPKADVPALLRLTGATRYRVLLDGNMLHFGPAKAAHGHFRVDELPLNLTDGGLLRIDVTSSNVTSYDGVTHPGFLQAEVVAGNEVIAATGFDFQSFRNLSRLQKVMRFGSSRQFSEVYRGLDNLSPVDWEVVPQDYVCIPREVAMPCMDIVQAQRITAKGTFVEGAPKENHHWFVQYTLQLGFGFSRDEMEAAPFDTVFAANYTPQETNPCTFQPLNIGDHEYVLYDFGSVYTGFMNLRIEVLEDTELIVTHEDLCSEKFITFERLRNQYINVVSWTLEKGIYTLENFDPFEMRYMQFNVLSGKIRVHSVKMRQYIHPACKYDSIHSGDEVLDKIYNAAVSTYRQNAVDVFTDCPTRERAGWLCDSYYTAQAEYTLTGDNRLERAFLKNFVDCGQRPELPQGMIPKNYPADIINGGFIPQWAMWYVLELEEALQRCPSMDKDIFKPLCYGLVDFFARYLNEDGLLESMPGWNFIDWSKCNSWVNGLNYPTNFLYSRILKAIGTMYDDPALLAQSAQIRETAMRLSFDGSFFTENALRDENGILHNTGNTSETCQYYAIHFCDPDLSESKYATLKNAFNHVFGPDHSKYAQLDREVEPSVPFIGVYLRMECLLQLGQKEKLLNEIKDFFGHMADLTGTLWEGFVRQGDMLLPAGSLNHGFAAYVATAIVECLR